MTNLSVTASDMWNFVTNEYDTITDWNDVSFVAQHLDEIGQRGLFMIYAEHLHMNPLEAFINVCSRAIGEPEPYPVPEIK